MGKNKLESIRSIVNRRIDTLLSEARGCVRDREEDSIKYIKLARRLAQRHRIAMGERKREYCPRCFRVFVQGENCKIRVSKDRQEILCSCGGRRTVFHKKKKEVKK